MKKSVLSAAVAVASLLSSTALADKKVDKDAEKVVNTKVNFAFGGARTDGLNATGIFRPDQQAAVDAAGLQLLGLSQQFDFADATLGEVDSEKDLFYLSVGTNDFISGLVLGQDAAGTAARIQDALESMYDLGARNIVIPNLAPIGTLPILNLFGLPPEARAGLNDLTAYFNGVLLPGAVAQFKAAHACDEVQVVIVDVAGIQASLATNPSFTNLTDSCLDTGAFPCNGYLFLDSVHPTTEVYEMYAGAACKGIMDVRRGHKKPKKDECKGKKSIFDRVITFGDSLADTGSYNDVVFRATNAYPLPEPVYYMGRFSNSLNVIDYLEDMFKVKYPTSHFVQPSPAP